MNLFIIQWLRWNCDFEIIAVYNQRFTTKMGDRNRKNVDHGWKSIINYGNV